MGSILIMFLLFVFLCLFGIGYILYTLFRAWTVPDTSFPERVFWTVAIIIFMPIVSILFSLIKERTWKGKIGPTVIMLATVILMMAIASNLAINSWTDFTESMEKLQQDYPRPAEDTPYQQEPIEINA